VPEVKPQAAGARARKSQASRQWEQASSQSDTLMLEPARRRWAALTAAEQMELAGSVAQCRRGEFTRHFRQVVSVAAGLKRRNDEAVLNTCTTRLASFSSSDASSALRN